MSCRTRYEMYLVVFGRTRDLWGTLFSEQREESVRRRINEKEKAQVCLGQDL